MTEPTLTQEHLDMCGAKGACDDIKRYKVGTPLSRINAGHLEWFAGKYPEAAQAIAKQATAAIPNASGVVPLALLGRSGYGGDGSGSGYGYGYGDGYGYGSGYGSGYGYGGGSGSGYGGGSGYGSGDGASNT